MFTNFRDGLPCIPGVVIERTGRVSYLVIVRDGELTWKRHVDHLRARTDSPSILKKSRLI